MITCIPGIRSMLWQKLHLCLRLSYLGIKTKKIDNVTILGAGRTGATWPGFWNGALPLNIKMIEKNPWQARK